jgi:hypothetical protein
MQKLAPDVLPLEPQTDESSEAAEGDGAASNGDAE